MEASHTVLLSATGAAAAAAAGVASWGAVAATSQLFGPTLQSGSDWREVALTFDDGPNERFTEEILEFLANYRVRATFFMIGAYVRLLPRLAREVVAGGHLVGNHTMTHPNLLLRSERRVRAELRDGNAALEDVLGAPVRFFRPPYGYRAPHVLRAARELGLEPVLWNARGNDWRSISPDAIYANLRRGMARNRKAGRGSNLLLHDGAHTGMGANRSRTATAVPMLLHRLKREGYRFVTVDAWLDTPAAP